MDGNGLTERIESGYNHGFTTALLKVKEQIDKNLYEDMKRHNVRFNVKNVQSVIDCMIENREILRDNPFAFIRCVSNGFEVFIERGKE